MYMYMQMLWNFFSGPSLANLRAIVPGQGFCCVGIKAHTSEARRRTLGLSEADVLGNEKAEPPPTAMAALEGPC